MLTRGTWWGTSSLMVALLIGSGCSVRQSPPAAALEKLPDTAAMADPRAALTRMGGYLRTLKTFTIRAQTTIDEVLADTGQKLQFGGEATLYYRAPAHLRVDVASERKDRQFFYDGKTLTVYGRRTGYYASVPAPPAVRELLEVAEQKYDLDFPLADLFFWGRTRPISRTSRARPTSARAGSAGPPATTTRSASKGWTGSSGSSGARRPCRASWSSRPPTTTPSRSTPPR